MTHSERTKKKRVSTTHSTEFWLWKLWEKSITHVNHIHTNKSMSSNVRTHRAKDFFLLFSFTSWPVGVRVVHESSTAATLQFQTKKEVEKNLSKKTNISILMFSLSQHTFFLVFVFYLTNLAYKLFIKFCRVKWNEIKLDLLWSVFINERAWKGHLIKRKKAINQAQLADIATQPDTLCFFSIRMKKRRNEAIKWTSNFCLIN